MDAVTTGEKNTAIGSGALTHASAADVDYNTCVGYNAGTAVQADSNTLIGYEAGDNITTGENNIFIGFHTEASAANVDHEIVIGAGTNTSTSFAGGGTDTIRLGRPAEYMEGNLTSNTWSHGSDIRIKKDIEDNVLGLAFINDLRTVNYKKKAPSEYPQEFDGYDANETERNNPDKKYYGFIAQNSQCGVKLKMECNNLQKQNL